MVSTKKDPVLAVVSLSGGNDGLNTVIPYNNTRYRDYRPTLGIPEDQIVHFTDELGFHPSLAPLKKYWDEGKLAVASCSTAASRNAPTLATGPVKCSR